VEGLEDPIDRDLARLLRRAVQEHVRSERRRLFPPVLHVGTPGGPSAHVEVGEPPEPGVRVDVVAALRVAAYGVDAARGLEPLPGREVCWLVRPARDGDPDGVWLPAARAAYAEAGAALVFVVVTRRGWRDPRSGLERTWVRLR
jgi:hypothetical protein